MKTRIISAILALLVFLPMLYYGSWPLMIGVMLLSLMAIREFFQMHQEKMTFGPAGLIALATLVLSGGNQLLNHLQLPIAVQPFDLYYILAISCLAFTVFHPEWDFDRISVYLLAAVYVGFGFNSILTLRDRGFMAILGLFLIVWATDSFAYFVGRSFGRHKLAPHISPNKTIEGSVGGSLIAVVVFMVFNSYTRAFELSHLQAFLAALFVSVLGQLGDLVESAFKRHYQVKDSGEFLPGHGGVLDRFDSLLFASVGMQVVLALVNQLF
ncbi:phosphatidate cytidylyltransferase [Atopobacter sp. AH10]|uniref:phosphatidate cytidylyltransferase n=1 Tax=Atopobacter sp. AH10 TaxID=2315861 RepID=UPI0013146E21|nr:phosphatidate cytidylyltransferase [Atopobacter sp. AH10]